MGATSATATQPSATTWLQDLSQSDHASGRQTIEDDIPEGYDLISQNETFELYANQETLAFKVLDKRNGYIWHSNLDEKIDGDRLNKTWTAFANSAISIEFIDQKVSETRASITNAEHTIVFTETSTGFQAVLTFTEPLITITLVVSLHKDGVTVEIPFDGIQEQNPDFRIAMMHVYPWFGAMRTESTGYMFIPDGSGSLIRFQPETKAQNPFYGRYYADDLGMITGFPYDPTVNPPYKISIPVIGMVHEEQQSGYIAIVEKGASYAEFRAHPAGIITNFNFLYNTFVYNQSYFQATNRSGAGVTVLQPATNQFDIKINYRFLAGEESNYVGMARSYQKYLIEKGDLTKQIQPTSDIGIRLEFLGGDYERVLFWKRMIPMTTLTQMSDILNSLEINNPEVIYYGWQPLGASSMPPRSIKLDSKLGDTRQLNNLLKQIQGDGGQFYLYLDPLAAFMDEPGYSTQGDLAMSVTNYNVVSYNRNKVNFFRNFPALESFYSAISRSVDDQFVTGLALGGISSNLYSDFKRGNFLNREQAIQSYQELLTNTGIATSFYSPNDYLFRFMRAFYDIPVSDSGYIYFTDTIPFLQIVFAGYIPVYGNALNFSSNLQEDLLRHADFGVWPSYFLTHEVTAKILDTGSNWIYTSSIGQWDDQVESTYQWLNSLLGPVKGAQVISREELSQDVFATTYTNGQMIIVNYSTQPFTEGNIRVGARDAVIVEVTP
jgi:hypothetical protein